VTTCTLEGLDRRLARMLELEWKVSTPFGYAWCMPDAPDVGVAATKHADMLAAIETAVQRRLRNGPNEFASVRQIMLPASKSGFPRIVILDFNHWIALSRVHYGLSSDAAARGTLDALRSAIAQGRVLVPVTDINLNEAMKDEFLDRRRRMAEFMVDLSCNFGLFSHLGVQLLEAWNSLAVFSSETQKCQDVRPLLLRWGFGRVFGRRPIATGDPFDDIANEVIDYPEMSVHHVVHGVERDRLRDIFADERAVMMKVEAIRNLDQDLPSVEHHRAELSNFPRAWLEPLLQAMGADTSAFSAAMQNEGNLSRFWDSVPSIDVLFTLMMARDRNRDAPTATNDARDLSFLRLALPHANIVLAERLWAHVANATKLTTKYGTTVTADLGMVPKLLREQGCL
jgi:hypothetical protein